MVVSVSTNQVCTKITVRSHAWSFGHLDPYPSNVLRFKMGVFREKSDSVDVLCVPQCQLCGTDQFSRLGGPYLAR